MLICSMFRFIFSQPSTARMSVMRLSSSSTSSVGVTMPGRENPIWFHMPRTNSSGSWAFWSLDIGLLRSGVS